ncbi:60s ribosomal l44 [Fusarium acutatum]|uniref:60s ribosomal l44 n=1 Tax=Fusarium acutatum TaxID=78861 RepID=A0A8H4JRQ4_9HYPO|nr:60s ribosomal l44 [Fusarium acutatum]
MSPSPLQPAMSLANMLDGVIVKANDEPENIQTLCESERRERYERYRAEFLSTDFQGLVYDDILRNILKSPGYRDPRHNLCVFARPTVDLMNTIRTIQQDLQQIAPGIWLTPSLDLHMTVLEIVHSETREVVDACLEQLQPRSMDVVHFARHHPIQLVRPQLSFDRSAVAMTFVPAADRLYTYLHLRRDLAELLEETGIQVASRYTTTSSHLTLARHIEGDDLVALATRKAWVSAIEAMNERLAQDGLCCYEWNIGLDSQLIIQKGNLWYGGGECVADGNEV